jgi:DNA-binding HxlR family transcriptional regulator
MAMQLCCTSSGGSCVELTEKEYKICDTICGSSHPVSFSELKHTSELHQEILSRILKRLQIHQVIEKMDDGKYRKPSKIECGQ